MERLWGRSRYGLGLALLVLAGCMGPWGAWYHNRFASPAPSVAIDPVNPCVGDHVNVRGSGAPANTTLEVWLMPQTVGGFKVGLYSPKEAGGVKLGTTTTDASGAFTYAFDFQKTTVDANRSPKGYYRLWLVYPPGDVIAPEVVGWQCPPATTVTGMAYDATGKPVPAGAMVEVKVQTDQGALIYDRTVPLVDGKYQLDDVPEPAQTTITVTVPGWPARSREDGIGGIQEKWAGYPSPPVSGDAYTRNEGNPLTYNFGGPATPEDPDATAYFLSANAADPDVAFTPLSGKVYDQTGALVPDSVDAKVIVGARDFHAVVAVSGGAYQVDRVPTGVPVSVDLRINPMFVLIHPRTTILIAPKISGKPNIINFGGPATPDDPDAPKHPFPSPVPEVTGPSPFVPAP